MGLIPLTVKQTSHGRTDPRDGDAMGPSGSVAVRGSLSLGISRAAEKCLWETHTYFLYSFYYLKNYTVVFILDSQQAENRHATADH